MSVFSQLEGVWKNKKKKHGKEIDKILLSWPFLASVKKEDRLNNAFCDSVCAFFDVSFLASAQWPKIVLDWGRNACVDLL